MVAHSRFQTRNLLPFIVLSVAVLVWLIGHDRALGWYGSKYTDSAHGSNAFGVKRRAGTPTSGYAQGNCAHCHEQHASVGGMSHTAYPFALFAENNPSDQTDNFCFECHKNLGSVQEGGITNYTYSKNFGGGSPTFTTIYDAFNPTSGDTPSSHNLSDIQTFAVGRGIGFTNDTNACVVCHDVHTAQRNYPVSVNQTLGGVNTAIRRPADYEDMRNNLWGDEDAGTSGFNERMIDYTNRYQAPYYKNGSPNRYEPANDETADGSNLPNFKAFCLGACHGSHGLYSTERGRNLRRIYWSSEGDMHGNAYQGGTVGVSIAPYEDGNFNYVLSCTDCHEPHGSKNEWLLRTCVNGKDDINVPGPGQWLDFCTACHDVGEHGGTWGPTTDCYNNGICHQHGGAFF